mgnify:CR=1 FL=1|jgi:hypothetical protein|tara:strand:+ start:437 stop:583 length:147 start_codon:yes stop_codon:yes gene_type:complete
MIQGILQLLEFVDGDTENIRIAQGKYELPKTFKKTFKQIKNDIKWRNK